MKSGLKKMIAIALVAAMAVPLKAPPRMLVAVMAADIAATIPTAAVMVGAVIIGLRLVP